MLYTVKFKANGQEYCTTINSSAEDDNKLVIPPTFEIILKDIATIAVKECVKKIKKADEKIVITNIEISGEHLHCDWPSFSD
ncbi:MAG: hypothetical protein IJS20_04895 [Bacteroidales bacterium]|nr:hypothetical protein [Bacteroidales bacterium]